MDLLEKLKQISAVDDFKSTSNFYFENHICTKNGNNTRINLDFVLSNEVTDEILRFGVCEQCNTCFYHKDFQSKGL